PGKIKRDKGFTLVPFVGLVPSPRYLPKPRLEWNEWSSLTTSRSGDSCRGWRCSRSNADDAIVAGDAVILLSHSCGVGRGESNKSRGRESSDTSQRVLVVVLEARHSNAAQDIVNQTSIGNGCASASHAARTKARQCVSKAGGCWVVGVIEQVFCRYH